MFECNYFKDVKDTDCTTVVPVLKVLSAIKNGKWKEQIEAVRTQESKKMITQLKNKLPNVTFSGVFEDQRVDNNIVMYNQLMIIDIDKIGPRKLIKLRRELKNNPYTVAYFAGPTKGLKVLFKVNTESNEHNTYAFHSVEEHFKTMYNVEIDPSGKNISRLCFVSYDPETYYNKNFKEFVVDRTVWERNPNFRDNFIHVVQFKSKYHETNCNKIVDNCRKMVNKSRVGTYRSGNRNNYIFALACLTSEFAVPEEHALAIMASKYQSLEFKELKNTINSAYRKTRNTFGSKNNSANSQGGMFDL